MEVIDIYKYKVKIENWNLHLKYILNINLKILRFTSFWFFSVIIKQTFQLRVKAENRCYYWWIIGVNKHKLSNYRDFKESYY